MKIHNPFGRLSKEDGVAKLERWSAAYQAAPQGRVYHYTSAAAFAGILDARSIFCTDHRQLNDTAELSTGIEVIEAAIAGNGRSAGLSTDDIDDALDHLALLRACPPMHLSLYATSFSFQGNDLTQWRAYAPSHGVSVGFRLAALQKLAADQNFVFGPILYLGSPEFGGWIAQRLSEVKGGLEEAAINERAFREKASNHPPSLVDLMVTYQRSGNLERWLCEAAGLVKNAGFRSEQEWRCLFVHRLNTIQPQKSVYFRSSGTRVVRYVELDLSQVEMNDLIESVTIGPGSSAEETLCIVGDLLRSAGITAPIYDSLHTAR
jgi:hypothetical protein